MTLRDLHIGQTAVVTRVGGEGALRQHFLDMGIVAGVEVRFVKLAPMGDPMQIMLRGYLLTLRLADAAQIEVSPEVRPTPPRRDFEPREGTLPHPGLGEEGRYHEEDQQRRRAEEAMESRRHGGRSARVKPAEAAVQRGHAETPGHASGQGQGRPADGQATGGRLGSGTAPSAGPRVAPGRAGRRSGAAAPGQPTSRRAAPSGSAGPTPRLTFALAGNQNCGKTTLFNQLTGANQHVGNFPGVTVDRKGGVIKGYPDSEIVDLPGIYSLSPYTAEEVVSRRFILDERPSGIFNIVDASNIERNLYLTMQLIELDTPMVLALNMMDEVEGNGGTVLVNEMEDALGIPVVPISAAKNEGVGELIEHAVHVARHGERPRRLDFCAADDHGGAVHRCIHAVMHLIEGHAAQAGIPVRFAATKLIEGDPLTAEALGLTPGERTSLELIVREMERERGLDRAAAIADMRFAFIEDLCARTVVKPRTSREQRRSEAIDRVLTGRWTALPAFLAILGFIFWFTFAESGVGVRLQDWTDQLLTWGSDRLALLLERWEVHAAVRSLVTDGICAGVTTVLTFMPLIVVLFFWLSMLEDSGYMARVAFVADRLLRRLGLSGRSIVPMLIGFGCTVPAVMATRTLPSSRDRRLTILLTPFMSCTAKVPIYAFFAERFFPDHAAWITVSLYVLGICVGVAVAAMTKDSLFRGDPVPFVMELPTYRMPGLRNTLQLMWEKARDFIYRAFTVIFLATIVIWCLQHFDWRGSLVDEAHGILAQVSGLVAPLFAPLGFGQWQWVTALVSGFLAKESVVVTLEVLFAEGDGLASMLTPVSAYTFLVFCLLYTPCVAAVAAVRRELGLRSALLTVVLQCVVAYVVALAVRLALSAFVG